MLRHDGYYYLFVSWDSCCDQDRSTYKVVVGRSKSILGPYVDSAGQTMCEGGGTLVLASYGKWRGPGHNSALSTSHGDWLVLAGFDATNLRRGRVLQIRRMYWPEGGWPVAGEALAAPVNFDRGNDKPGSPVGTWKLWADYGSQQSITLEADGRISGDGRGSWRQAGCMLTIDAKGRGLEKLFLEPEGRSFVGRNAEGQVIFGQRVP